MKTSFEGFELGGELSWGGEKMRNKNDDCCFFWK